MIRESHKCPLCGSKCKEIYREKDFTTVLFDCPNCKDYVMQTFISTKGVLDVITKEEKILLAKYFSKIPSSHCDRRLAITINNYKDFIERAKKIL